MNVWSKIGGRPSYTARTHPFNWRGRVALAGCLLKLVDSQCYFQEKKGGWTNICCFQRSIERKKNGKNLSRLKIVLSRNRTHTLSPTPTPSATGPLSHGAKGCPSFRSTALAGNAIPPSRFTEEGRVYFTKGRSPLWTTGYPFGFMDQQPFCRMEGSVRSIPIELNQPPGYVFPELCA